MDISKDRVRALAKLCRLELNDEALTSMQLELSRILELVEELSELELADVEATTHAIPLRMPLRKDAHPRTLPTHAALAAAPQTDGSFFLVPRVVERAHDEAKKPS